MSISSSPQTPFGTFGSDTTLTIQRRLPGPISRVWSYLTDSALRAQWLASGTLPTAAGGTFELVWRNDSLSTSASERPAGYPEISRATCVLTEFMPERKLRFTWPEVGDVTILLEHAGDEVLLTLTHRACNDRGMRALVGAGWHAHLDILVARVGGTPAPSFWTAWQALLPEYGHRSAA